MVIRIIENFKVKLFNEWQELKANIGKGATLTQTAYIRYITVCEILDLIKGK